MVDYEKRHPRGSPVGVSLFPRQTMQQFIHHVTIDTHTYNVLLSAADTAKMSVTDFEAWVLADWAQTYQRRQNGRQEFIAALQETTWDIATVPVPSQEATSDRRID